MIYSNIKIGCIIYKQFIFNLKNMRVINSSCLLLLALFTFLTLNQNLVIYPEDTYNSTVPSSRACFSDCQYCQILTNQC